MKKFHGSSEPTPRIHNILNAAFHLQSGTVKHYHTAQLTIITISDRKNSESAHSNDIC